MATGTNAQGLSFRVASRGTSILGLSFNVERVVLSGKPISKEIFGPLDEAGLVLGLKRIPGEESQDYKRRIKDVFVHRSNSTYRGLINGITREIGLSFTKPIRIWLRRNSNGTVGRNPAVEFNGPQVRVWGDFKQDANPELTINRWNMTIADLVDAIDASAYVACHQLVSEASLDRAMTVINQNTYLQVESEHLKNTTVNQLEQTGLVRDSVFFRHTDSFVTSVGSPTSVNSTGEYHIDYISGIVFSNDLPGERASVRYQYLKDPFDLEASPVIINATHEELFKQQIFHQITLEDGSTVHGLPTRLGTDIISELHSNKNLLWGE